MHCVTSFQDCECAFNFEELLDIVGDNVLKEDIFGHIAACGLTGEEQCRKSLHAHILVSMPQWNKTLSVL
mgnify:CR=1 FL=1